MLPWKTTITFNPAQVASDMESNLIKRASESDDNAVSRKSMEVMEELNMAAKDLEDIGQVSVAKFITALMEKFAEEINDIHLHEGPAEHSREQQDMEAAISEETNKDLMTDEELAELASIHHLDLKSKDKAKEHEDLDSEKDTLNFDKLFEDS